MEIPIAVVIDTIATEPAVLIETAIVFGWGGADCDR